MTYFIFHTLSLLIFWAFYQVFLRKDTFFERNRWYLLLSLGVALLAPVLEISLPNQSASEIAGLQTFVLPEISIAEAKAESWSWFQIVKVIYFLGAAISLILFAVRLGKLLFLIRPTTLSVVADPASRYNKSRYTTLKPLTAFSTTGRVSKVGTFSFFNYLFWDNSLNLSKEEEKQILEHELAHIKGGHSYDLMYLELQKIVFWFNPIIYLYEKELRNQHEFIADSKATRLSNTESYVSLMVSSLFKNLQINFTHSFHNQQIKQRIKMLNTEKTSKISGNAKTVLAVALVAIVAVAVACTKTLTSIEKDQNLSEMKVAQGQNQKDLLQAYSKELQEFGKKYPKLFEGQNAELTDAAQLNTAGISKKDKERISFVFNEIQEFIKQQNQERMKTNLTKMPDENEVFTVVEKNASPVGGMQEFYKLMGENIKYPAQAAAEKVEGKVYVQFVIDLDGSLKDVQVVKGIGKGCDEEAMRVIALTKWEAGEQAGKKIKQRMVMPIIFKLN